VVAVDTNVIVRLLTQDERKQAVSATAIFAEEAVWIGKTVLLETAWVLKSSYGYRPEAVRNALSMLLGLPNVHVEDRPAIAGALSLAAQGLDIADALHFKSRPRGAKFVSFDDSFVRRARRAGLADVEGI
jgi:predicted nucleic-acid-binding protein